MNIKSIDIGITTDKLVESRDFYGKYLGFRTVWEGDWYIHLENGNIEMGLLQPNHPSQPPIFHEPYPGHGMWLSFEVDDVDAEYARLREAGLSMDVEIRNEAWGQRHFCFRDPNGLVIDLIQKIPMTAEYQAGYTESAVS
jgi:catechol 2,3-dioxygenase-like lactoylglutathione lyase family enzyme